MSQDRTTAQRLKDPTPPYFKKVRKISLTVAAAGGILVGLNAGVPSLEIPIVFKQIGEILVYVGGAVAGFSFLPSTKA